MKDIITSGQTALGIEFGSTRVKAVLVDTNCTPIASGSFEWENRLTDGYWSYPLDEIHTALKECFKSLKKDVFEKYGCTLTTTGAMGISAMMHGYLAFDKKGNLLTPFRTWRNTTTEKAAEELTKAFSFNIPQRWTVAHLYQAILDKEAHVPEIAYVTTLAGYIHYMLTGVNAVGVGEASGIFPIDSTVNNYDAEMVKIFDEKTRALGFQKDFLSIVPKVLTAGDDAGCLTEKGALMLDESGEFKPGVPFAPAEGDAGTGMVATNSVKEKTGNVSAGTSVFAMIVLSQKLSRVYPEIDMVTTPTGKPVAMVHCNNCTNEINAWADVFLEIARSTGSDISRGKLFDMLYEKAKDADKDCGGLLSYNFLSGEPVLGLNDGRPMFLRTPDSKMNLANFSRSLLYTAMATLKIGLDLLEGENVTVDCLYGHGGFFIYPVVGPSVAAAALDIPVSVLLNSKGEGGPYGMALLALYRAFSKGEALEDFLKEKAFGSSQVFTALPDEQDKKGFGEYIERFKAGLESQKAAFKVK